MAFAGDIGPDMRALLRQQRLGYTVKTLNQGLVQKRRLMKAGAESLRNLSHAVNITLNDGFKRSDLEASGVKVLMQVGKTMMCFLPDSLVEKTASLPAVRSLELQKNYFTKLNYARKAVGIDRIHAGEGLPQAYTGKGVVTGIVDTGMDPNHVNFQNEDGTSRIGYFSSITINQNATSEDDAIVTREYDGSTISTFKTENSGQYHGTHTMGILAGSYKGDMQVAVESPEPAADGSLVSTNETMPCPYYGAATGSTIAAACGSLQDIVIATGVDNILNYAYNEKKPSVISLSIGSNDGPHDGTEVMNQFLDLASKESIICLSAGNEGDLPVALHKEFTAEDTTMQTFVFPMTYSADDANYPNLRYGTVKIYSRDATPLKVQAVVYNKTRKKIAFRMPIDGNTQGISTYYCSDASFQESDADIISSLLQKAVNGYVGLGSKIDENSGRYYAMIDFYVTDNQETNQDGKYLVGIVVEGAEGQRCDMFSDAQFMSFSSYSQPSWQDGMTDGSISSMACGKDVIVVGSYNTRNRWASMDGVVYGLQDVFPEGEVTNFSSYGTLVDGRSLPTVCAPGTTLVSSCNYYYYDAASKPSGMIQALKQGTDRDYPYIQTMGTSMSTPLVAGSIALWLEADPTLTAQDVKDIIAKTAVRDADVKKGNPVQWGAGKFDAYAGLKEVLSRQATGINSTTADTENTLVRSVGDRLFEVFCPMNKPLNVSVYSLSGELLLSEKSNGNTLTLNASALKSGIYVLRANGKAQKIMIQ